MLEINPLIVMKDGHLRALDAKVSFDSAMPCSGTRTSGAARRDRGRRQGDRGLGVGPRLHRARWHDRLHGQRRGPRHGDHGHHQALWREPGQFLDVGGGASEGEGDRRPSRSSRRIPNVKGILVNIFGGIMKCDVIAEGVLAAVKETVGLSGAAGGPPRGHQRREGQADHPRLGLAVIPADDLDDAAQKIVAAVRGN
jgi:succinyl-CoA synthetase beta subunit